MNNQNPKDCPIIISSCDNYSDVWEAFFTFFFKHWPDCPFDVYLLSGTKIYADKRVKTIALGTDQGWSDNMRLILAKINKPYFINFSEDLFLLKKVETKKILDLFDLVVKERAAYLRLYPVPGPDMKFRNYNDVGLISIDAPYRISLQTSIWRTDIFLNLLVAGEDAWEMEIKGTERSKLIKEPFLSVATNKTAIDYFATAIKKGRWRYDAVKLCEKIGIKLDLKRRPVESYKEYVIRKISGLPVIGQVIKFPRRLISLILKTIVRKK